jgi:hypothetical protein
VTIQEFKGKSLVSIREYYKKDGKELPTSKGTLKLSLFYHNFSEIVEPNSVFMCKCFFQVPL